MSCFERWFMSISILMSLATTSVAADLRKLPERGGGQSYILSQSFEPGSGSTSDFSSPGQFTVPPQNDFTITPPDQSTITPPDQTQMEFKSPTVLSPTVQNDSVFPTEFNLAFPSQGRDAKKYFDGLPDNVRAILKMINPDVDFDPPDGKLDLNDFQGDPSEGLKIFLKRLNTIESVAPGEPVGGTVGIPKSASGQLVQVSTTQLAAPASRNKLAADRITAPAFPMPARNAAGCTAPSDPKIPSDGSFFNDVYLASIDKTTGKAGVKYCRDGFSDVVFIELDGTSQNTCSGVLVRKPRMDKSANTFLITAGHCIKDTMKVFVALPENMDCLEKRVLGDSVKLASEECGLNGLDIDLAQTKMGDEKFDIGVLPIRANAALDKITQFGDITDAEMDGIVLLTNAGFGRTSVVQSSGKTGQLNLNWSMGEKTDEPLIVVKAILKVSREVAANLACGGDSGGPVFLGRPFGYSDERHEIFAITSQRDSAGEILCSARLADSDASELINVRNKDIKAFLCAATSNSLSYCNG